MPHIAVKLWPNYSEEQKQALAGALAEGAAHALSIPREWITVGIEEIPEERWDEEVYQPEILGKQETLYVKPDALKK